MAIDFETLTVSTTSVGISSGIVDQQHNYAFITVETAAIRFRLDGTAPTASVGHPAEAGSTITLNGDEVPKFRAIRRDGVDSSLSISTGFRKEEYY